LLLYAAQLLARPLSHDPNTAKHKRAWYEKKKTKNNHENVGRPRPVKGRPLPDI
jgi:hypothetical protein